MSASVLLPRSDRFRSVAAALVLPGLCLVLTRVAPAAETAPSPREAGRVAAKQAAQNPVQEVAVQPTAGAADAEATQTASSESTGTVSRLKKRLLGMFGG